MPASLGPSAFTPRTRSPPFMLFTNPQTPSFALLTLGLSALLVGTPSCCTDKSDYDSYDYDYYEDDDDTASPETVTATRDPEDDCVFHVEVEGRGEAMLRSALVSGAGSVVPSSVQLVKGAGDVANAGTISGTLGGDDGWTAVFSASTLDGSPNGPVGSVTDFDGTWTITLTVEAPNTCADIEDPLSLKLVADG